MIRYVDIHSHLYFPDFDTDREAEIEKIRDAGIATISIGTDLDTSRQALDLAQTHEHLFACVGHHPGHSEGYEGEKLAEMARDSRVVCIGECGFDYFRNDSVEEKKRQTEIFEDQIRIALSVDKPLMLHLRPKAKTMDAYLDALDILESQHREVGDKLRGNAHFFAGDREVLKRFLDIGFSVSFTGVVTFTRDYDENVRYVPEDAMLAETDSPFVAPVPHRGGRNSPLFVPLVVEKLAEIRGEEKAYTEEYLLQNSLKRFSIAQNGLL